MATHAAVSTGKVVVRLNGSPVDNAQVGAALADGSQNSNALMTFFQLLLTKLLFDDTTDELVEHAADALLALILCYGDLFSSMIAELSAKLTADQPEAGQHHVARLQAEVASLVSNNDLEKSLERKNKLAFRANLRQFLTTVRGFINTK
eukprot:SAG31_NODE_2670_length_5271_cov_4.007541_2_plen_149_part_00